MSSSPGGKPEGLPDAAFRALFEASPAPIWVYDTQTQCAVSANRRALDCFGDLEQLPATPSPRHGAAEVLLHRRGDGAVVALRLDASRMDIAGRAMCLVVAVDVTEETRALAKSEHGRAELAASESALRKSERRFRQLFETASDWYWEADPHGRLTFVSPNFEKMFGIKLEDRIGRRLNDVAEIKIEPESALKALAAIRAQLPYSDFDYTLTLPDGRKVSVTTTAVPMVDDDGRFCGYCGHSKNITARVEAERALRDSERQVHHSQRLEALGTLAGGVAHEINNALVPVVALTKMVVRKLPEDSRERRNLDTVVTAAERSRDLVKQILAFSRKDEEERRRENVDVGTVLHDALQLMRATLPASIRLEEEIAPTPPVIGDAGQLQQVIVNIMTNAAQAIGAAQGLIAVRLEPDAAGTVLRLAISDTGCGMDEATQARIFEPFFTTKQVGEGTGLGLSVAHGIIKEHGGRIEVASKPGEGTRFEIIFPVAAAAAGAAA